MPKNSYHLPAADWRTRKASGICIIQSKSKDLRTKEANVQGQEKMDVPTQAKKANLPFLPTFYSQQIGYYSPTLVKISLLSLLTQMLISSGDILITTQITKVRKIVYQVCGHVLAQTS